MSQPGVNAVQEWQVAGQIVGRGTNTWLVRIALGRDARGKRLYHNKTVHGTKKDAERYRTKVLREIDLGTFVKSSQEYLEPFIRSWLETSVKPRVRERTLADYQSLAERYLYPSLGALRLSQVTPQAIQRAYAELTEKELSARTVRYAHSVLHGALEQAVKWKQLTQNPAKLVDLPRRQRREMRAFGKAEAAAFLKAAEKDRYYALWLLLLTSGLRPGEALGLKWGDLDENRIQVQRSLVRYSDGRWELTEPKTSRARRIVTLPPTAVAALTRHRALQAEDRLRSGGLWSAHDLIFANRNGDPLDYRVVVRRHFRPLAAECGFEGIRPYDLRHSCATLLLAVGENVKVVSERLGHTSAALTLDVYSHVLPDMQQRAAERLEAVLFG